MKKIGLGGHATTYMVRVYCLAAAVISGTWAFGLVWIMGQYPDIFTVELWYQLTWGMFLVTISLYTYYLSNHRWAGILLPLNVLSMGLNYIWGPYLRLSRAFWAWGFFGIVQAAYGILLIVGASFSLLHLIFMTVLRGKEKKGRTDHHWFTGHFIDMWQSFKREWRSKKHVHLGFIIVTAGSCFISQALLNNWFIPANASVTLDPPDYQIKFQAYGRSLYTNYTAPQLDSLNRHHFRIIDGGPDFIEHDDYTGDPYLWWLNLTDYKQTTDYINKRNSIINRFTPWLSGAPNVTFVIQLRGIPGGFPTDYAVTSGYYGQGALLINAWLTLEVVVEANLTNVVGIHTDQEGISNEEPVYGYPPQPITESRDHDRNLQARNNYLQFLDRLRYYEQNNATWATFISDMNSSHDVDHFLFTTTYDGAYMDGLDGDWDIDVFNMNIVNTVPYDEFLPMLYNQGKFPPDEAHYALYMQMKTLEKTLEVAGYPERIGALLGCMGAGDGMFMDTYTGTQFMDGVQQEVNGFDVVARQIMIAKAFGCEYVSFFPMNAYCNEGGCYFQGIFETFGDTFYDDLNDTVNAPNSSDPFTIRYYPLPDFMQTTLVRDVFLSGGWEWWYLGALVGCFVFAWIHHKFFPNVRSPRSSGREREESDKKTK
ncbi:MAG: hypothetical protein ACFFCS_00250 [Candidatus Hodarchaeota archaeon]